MLLFDIISNTLATVCVITTIIRFSMPYKEIYEIYQTRITEKFPYLILVNQLICQVIWFTYWNVHWNPFFIFLAIYCSIVSQIFLFVFVYCCDILETNKNILYSIIGVGPIVSVIILRILNLNLNIIGITGITFTIFMFLSPFQKILECFKKEDNSYLPIRLIKFNLFSSCCYVIYGTFFFYSLYVIVPHTLSILIAISQILVYNYFDKTDKFEFLEKEDSSSRLMSKKDGNGNKITNLNNKFEDLLSNSNDNINLNEINLPLRQTNFNFENRNNNDNKNIKAKYSNNRKSILENINEGILNISDYLLENEADKDKQNFIDNDIIDQSDNKTKIPDYKISNKINNKYDFEKDNYYIEKKHVKKSSLSFMS